MFFEAGAASSTSSGSASFTSPASSPFWGTRIVTSRVLTVPPLFFATAQLLVAIAPQQLREDQSVRRDARDPPAVGALLQNNLVLVPLDRAAAVFDAEDDAAVLVGPRLDVGQPVAVESRLYSLPGWVMNSGGSMNT